MTRVPWTTLHPSETEAVVSVMLLRERPNAVRVRPSRGDGGIDVIEVTPEGWLVDQLKYFATNLTSGQKAQIERSYWEVRRFAASMGARIARWRLVLPLDPTNENRAWFDGFTADAPFSCHWQGLAFLEGLAAKYPEVIDYYLKDGKDRLAALMAQVLGGLSLQQQAGAGEALEPIDTVEGLAGIYEALNAHDPHYRYGYSVDIGPPVAPAEPFLVAVSSRSVGEAYVTFRVYARFAQALEERPVPIKLQFRVPTESNVAEALRDFHTYGAPVTIEDPTGEMLSADVWKFVRGHHAAVPGAHARSTARQPVWGQRGGPAGDARPQSGQGCRWHRRRACDSTIVAGSTDLDLGRSAAGMRVITHGTLTAIMVSSTLRPTIGVTGAMRSRRQMTRGKAEQRAGERPARWPAVAGVVLVVAMPVASWWLVGDLSTETADPDYFLRPVDLGDTAQHVVGVGAVVLVAASAVALVVAGWRGRLDRRWWSVLVELVLAGGLCGAGWRVLTAGVIGANIGAGFVMVVVAPIVAALVSLAVLEWLSLRTQRRPPRTRG
jgi:hypothetical protein